MVALLSEERILEFKSQLIEYCKKGEDLWRKLADEGLIECNYEKAVLCNEKRRLYEEERRQIEKDILNYPYLFFGDEEDSEGVDDTLRQSAKTWKRYYHPVKDGGLVQRLLPEKTD